LDGAVAEGGPRGDLVDILRLLLRHIGGSGGGGLGLSSSESKGCTLEGGWGSSRRSNCIHETSQTVSPSMSTSIHWTLPIPVSEMEKGKQEKMLR
jgi:hypothetical protein